jgi:hypothetical protein
MVAPTYANSPLSFLLSNADIHGRFSPTVLLLTIQEVTFNEINSLRVGGLQVKIGGRSRQKTENRDLKYEIASARRV